MGIKVVFKDSFEFDLLLSGATFIFFTFSISKVLFSLKKIRKRFKFNYKKDFSERILGHTQISLDCRKNNLL